MQKKSWHLAVLWAFFIVGALTCTRFIFADYSNVMWYQWRNVFIVRHVAQQGYFVYDIVRTLSLKAYQESGGLLSLLDKNSLKQVESFREQNVPPGDLAAKYTLGERRLNVIVLQLESLDYRLFTTGTKGCKHVPFLCRIQQSSLWFENAFDQTAAGRTSDAEILTLTSVIPISNQIVATFHDLSNLSSLPKKLRKLGYYSFYAQGNTSHSYQRQRVMTELGFDQIWSMENLDQSDLLGKGVSDESFFKQIAQQVKKLRQPFFGFFISLTSHHPYKDVSKRQGKPDMGLASDYLVSINYLDQSLEKFFALLENNGILENTLFVMYGDHNSAVPILFGEPEPPVKKIPLFFYMKTQQQTGPIQNYSALQDIMPTILFELGLTPPKCLAGSPWGANSKVILPRGEILSPKLTEKFPSFEFSISRLYRDSEICL